MPHIKLPDGVGILALMAYDPKLAKHLNAIVDHLLRDKKSTLSRGERELIAAYVSYLNGCEYCAGVHGACAAVQLENGDDVVKTLLLPSDRVFLSNIDNITETAISSKMKSLLDIAYLVTFGGKHVTPAEINTAKQAGATDREIHDTIAIASMFCFFNRYVDGLGTTPPEDPNMYKIIGKFISKMGYGGPPPKIKIMIEKIMKKINAWQKGAK